MGSDDDSSSHRTKPLSTIRWFLSTDHEGIVFLRELLGSVAIVAMVGLLLFAVSGVWPPMIVLDDDSMEPHITSGDLVFVMEEDRLAPEEAYGDTGVVTYVKALNSDYTKLGKPGDVIVYKPDGSDRQAPILHRARFYVDSGENWYDDADPQFVPASYSNCQELPNCPAPHSGFVTLGDNNEYYDQAKRTSRVVKPEWIRGTAELKIPWLGHVRLLFSNLLATAGGPMAPAGPTGATGAVVAAGPP